MKFKNLVLTLGVLMMLAFTSMAAAAPSQVNRSMTAINAAKAEIPAVCELVGYNVDGDTSIITFKDPNTLERYVVDVNTATAKVQEIEVKGATFVMGSTMVTKTPDDIEKIDICGPDRNSYSKTDKSATFMRIKTDYMGNDQLLPAYNVQIGVADEYIAVVDVNHYRSDMDCFIPLMKHFKQTYGFYPKYPVADAGYGSYNNYIFCEQNGMEKYMKFPMFKKETKERKYHEDPFRAVNFRIDEQGVMRCPNDKAFHLLYRRSVRGNQYGRKEELYECEDCSGCPYAEKCKKTAKNRTVRINQELTAMHQEVIENLESIHGALLRMNRSIQAEGTFGIMKNDRWYKRIVRRGINSVKLEVLLVAIGHNLYKYQNKKMRNRTAA